MNQVIRLFCCALGLAACLALAKDGVAQQVAEPGGDAASEQQAQSQPDEYAWRLFEFINLQAAPGAAGVAGGKPITAYDDNQPTVWETWALGSGDGATQKGSEVYKPDGSDPGLWSSLPRSTAPLKVFSINLKVAAQKATAPNKEHISSLKTKTELDLKPLVIGTGDPARGFEVRLNEGAFGFVQQNGLFNIEGLAAKYDVAKKTGNRDLVQFPKMAKEVKADWVPTANPTAISKDEKARYHWRKVGAKYYKLVGFHITSKDLKQWFWADFAQEDYETTPGPALPSRDSTTQGANAPSRGTKDGERKELVGTKWAHYRLRGTQIDFLNSQGQPVVVGNTMIERGTADKSSCMTCHFAASMADVQDGDLDTLSGGNFVVGKPDTAALGEGTTIRYLQNDFVWSAPFRAQHKANHP